MAGLVFLCYARVWNAGFIWDDDAHITRLALRSINGLFRIWEEPGATQQYYPLVHSVFWLEHMAWGDFPLGYHLVNVLMHSVAALLLWRILQRLEVPGAWLAAALFALHPVQVETVAWVSELKNTLSGVCCLGAALVYLDFDENRGRRSYAEALGLFLLGLMSKTVIATLPGALLVVFWWKRGAISWRKDVVPLLPFAALGMGFGLFTAWVERTYVGAAGGDYNFNLVERCLIAGRAVCFYLGKLFWPQNLTFIYPRWEVSQAVWWQYLFPAGVILVLAILWGLRRINRGPLAAGLYFIGTLFPALGFINVYPFRYSFVADHFQYLAAIGPLTLAAAGIQMGIGRMGIGARAGEVCRWAILLALGVLTWVQCGEFEGPESLWRTTIARNPGCWMAYNNLADVLAAQGHTEEALAGYHEALRLNPDYREAHLNLGTMLINHGHVDEGIAQYREAVRLKPDYVKAHYSLGAALEQQGKTAEAIAEYREALRIDPDYAVAHRNLGIALFLHGHEEEGAAETEKALELDPSDTAIEVNLAWMLATASQASVRNGPRAIELALKASQTPGGDNANTMRTLAIAYAADGEFENAIQNAQSAIQMAEDKSDPALASELRREIKLYEARRPFEPAQSP